MSPFQYFAVRHGSWHIFESRWPQHKDDAVRGHTLVQSSWAYSSYAQLHGSHWHVVRWLHSGRDVGTSTSLSW